MNVLSFNIEWDREEMSANHERAKKLKAVLNSLGVACDITAEESLGGFFHSVHGGVETEITYTGVRINLDWLADKVS